MILFDLLLLSFYNLALSIKARTPLDFSVHTLGLALSIYSLSFYYIIWGVPNSLFQSILIGMPFYWFINIMGNGDYLHPGTGKWLGNLLDYIY